MVGNQRESGLMKKLMELGRVAGDKKMWRRHDSDLPSSVGGAIGGNGEQACLQWIGDSKRPNQGQWAEIIARAEAAQYRCDFSNN